MEVIDLHKSYLSGGRPLEILKGVSLHIYRGESIALTGASGSGKSTLLSLLAGLDRVTQGQILLRGDAMQAWDEDRLARWRREEVGFVFQDFRLVKSFTALENVSLPLEILGWDGQKARQRAEELLEHLSILPRAHHFPHQLSGGEQQRVAIARAYAHRPLLIFADEPTGNLDPETSQQVLDSLLNINDEEQTTLIMVTHDMSVAQRMKRHIPLRAGRLEEDIRSAKDEGAKA
ncbi:MAG: ABC transporter ATP-binding protein [Myxococcales bacterium]|nr:ABC transporter ATP-binding protein [Myxococcales bacterium]MCB9643609.1 ABC transporter ATP-binding protein [Myxococcales bacterium]